MPHDSHPDPAIIEQRIRNRQLEWLEMVIAFAGDPPPFDVNELINQWFDWNPDTPDVAAYSVPTYTSREANRLMAVGEAMNRLCDVMPNTITDEAATFATPEWAEVLGAAKLAIEELTLRGRLPEDD